MKNVAYIVAAVIVVLLAVAGFLYNQQNGETLTTDPMTGCQYIQSGLTLMPNWQQTDEGYVHVGCRLRTVRPVQGLPSTSR